MALLIRIFGYAIELEQHFGDYTVIKSVAISSAENPYLILVTHRQ